MQNSKFRKSLALILSLVLVVTGVSFVAGAADVSVIDYQITNPYDAVDWDSWGSYRTSLHNHSFVTDGRADFKDMIELHYELGYDALAMTDHGTTDYGWVDNVNTVPLLEKVMKLRRGDNNTPSGVTAERYAEISTGADRDGRKMVRIPFGNEQNPTSFNNAHVNTWFADYGNGYIGGTSDYETPIKAVDALGGVSVINHPGEYTGAKKEGNPEKAYNSSYSYKIDKYASLIAKYDSLLGIDINSKKDGRTKNDRKLWDILLQKVVPTGRNVYAIASSDAHDLETVDSGWVIAMMPENNVENIKTALLSGSFFAGSRYIKNTKELAILSEEVGRDLGSEWQANPDALQPVVTNIDVDDAADVITIDADNAETIHWIANGVVIATGNSIDLNDYSDQIGSYVRAELFSDGGVLYTQAFTLDYDGAPQGDSLSGFMDFGKLLSVFREIMNMIFAPFLKK